MGKVAKQLAAVFFLNLWKVTGYKVKKITHFNEQHVIDTIAIVSTTALGDFILNTPSINAIKARWPKAKLLLIINQRNEELVAGSGLFDEIIFWNGKVNNVIKIAATLRQHNVDATFILHAHTPYDIIAASMAFSTYIIKDVYFNDYHGRKNFALAGFLSAHYDNREPGGIHFIEQKARLLDSVGIDMPSKAMFIPAPVIAEQSIIPLVGIHAGASSMERCWPAEKFTRLIQMLIANHPQLGIVLIGGAGEKALNQRIIDSLSDGQEKVRNLAGKTSLQQLAACISSFSCLVVGDTGPLHVAVALKTSVVALFGSKNNTVGAAPIQDLNLHRVMVPENSLTGVTTICVEDVYYNVNQILIDHKRLSVQKK